MKGLLLKDMYMAFRYCRVQLLVMLVFMAISSAGDNNMFLIFYPCLLSGMIPVTLLSYDERSKWSEYVCTLPYTRAQIVSAKYIIGLTAQLIVLALSGIAQAVRLISFGNFSLDEFLPIMSSVLIMSCLASSISLPFMFRLGVEKGRMAYYIMIGVVCGGSVAASSLFENIPMASTPTLPVLCLLSIAVYALSWYLSIVFYKKREI